MEVSINISCSAKTAAVPVICYVYTTGPQCDKIVQGPQGVKIYNGCTAICKTTPVSKGFYPNHQHFSLYTKKPNWGHKRQTSLKPQYLPLKYLNLLYSSFIWRHQNNLIYTIMLLGHRRSPQEEF